MTSQGFQLLPQGASSVAGRVDALHLFIVTVTGSMATLVALLVIVFCVRYRRRAGNELATTKVHGLIRLELLWSAVPLLVFLLFFGLGAWIYLDMRRLPTDGMRIDVAAKQWMWKFQHPTGHREINSLHVPIGTNVLLTMTSEDVIHSFYVPAFRTKFDVLPQRYTQAWFRATRLGRHHLFCAEYCGTKHAEMIGQVVVMEPTEYEAWLAGRPDAKDPVQAGAALFEGLRCDTCHVDDPERRGPPLEGVYGSQVALADGTTITADETYLRESILEPAKRITAGFQPLMPSYAGQLGEQDVTNLVAYLKSLPPAEEGER